MLRELDIKTNPDDSPVVFSIVFVKKNGERVFLIKAIKTGLRFNVSDLRMRGIQPVDSDNRPAGHVYPVLIDNILEFNGMEVIL